MITRRIHEDQGFRHYVLGNSQVQLEVVPELGAKIVSMRNLRTGREWMAAPDSSRKLFRNQRGDDFHGSTYVGWDECVPTVDPCVWNGRNLPDHGEVWSNPWHLDEQAWLTSQIRTTIQLAVSPFQLTRAISLNSSTIHFDYSLENLADREEQFVWAAHPLFTMEPGDSLELPASTVMQLNNPPWLYSLIFPEDMPQWAKAFAGPLSDGRATIRNAHTSDALTLEWDPKVNDTLAIWLSRGGWNSVHQFSLEPTNATHEALAIAAAPPHRCGRISAHEQLSWQLSITLDPH
jgi:hypothetical protein